MPAVLFACPHFGQARVADGESIGTESLRFAMLVLLKVFPTPTSRATPNTKPVRVNPPRGRVFARLLVVIGPHQERLLVLLDEDAGALGSVGD